MKLPATLFSLLLIGTQLSAADAVWKLAFGSCNNPDKPQPLWSVIAAQKPDVWVWLGDIVYADTGDPKVLRETYAKQTARPEFQAFQKVVPKQLGTYDDHDYGLNDSGNENPIRKESMQELLNFLHEPAESPRRKQPGAYASYLFGDPGKQVKVILLDTRFNRDPIGSGGTILGEEQWKWLEQELRDSKAAIHIIGSSIQVLSQEHRFEKWRNFPKERERLFSLIAESRAPGVILLSGDRHWGELSCVKESPLLYPLYDLTSSGLTHSWKRNSEENPFRVGSPFTELNYGLVTVNWSQRTVALALRGEEPGAGMEVSVSFDELKIP